jgi:hypothetical protein
MSERYGKHSRELSAFIFLLSASKTGYHRRCVVVEVVRLQS